MSDTPTPAAQPAATPTPAEAQALGMAAAEGAHQNPANPQHGAEQAIEREAAARNVTISDEDKRQIARMAAEMNIQLLDERGAFSPPPAAPPAPAPAEPASEPPAAAAGGSDPEPAKPHKRSFAEWFNGS